MEPKTNYEIIRKKKSHLFHTPSDIIEHVDPMINDKFANDPFILVECNMPFLLAMEHAQKVFEVSNIQSQVFLWSEIPVEN